MFLLCNTKCTKKCGRIYHKCALITLPELREVVSDTNGVAHQTQCLCLFLLCAFVSIPKASVKLWIPFSNLFTICGSGNQGMYFKVDN